MAFRDIKTTPQAVSDGKDKYNSFRGC